MRNLKLSFAPLASLTVGITALALSSCGDSDDGVRVYEVIIPPGSETPAPAAPTQPTAPNTLATAKSDGPALIWSAPESWTKIANANQFDRARYEVGDGENKAIATVTAGIGGGVMMNVNRWRGQLGLGAASESELKAAAIPVLTPDSSGVIFDLSAPDESRKIIAAILPIPGDTFYFKLDGPGATVEAGREAFMAMVNSSKIDRPGSTETTKTTAAAKQPTLQFDTPDGWTNGSNDGSSSMRTASYITADKGEVSILLFRDSPDAIVQNVNIWRQEAGLDDATSEDQLEFTEVKTTDGELTWKVHQVDGKELAVLAAFATQGDTLWVVRLKSTPANVSKDKAEMIAFLQSATSK